MDATLGALKRLREGRGPAIDGQTEHGVRVSSDRAESFGKYIFILHTVRAQVILINNQEDAQQF